MNVLPLFRGYVVDTGQEFVNTRGADSNAEPLEFDSGMGILPEAIDMTGTMVTVTSNSMRMHTM